MSAAVALINRLEGVKATGPGRWIARCPAHEDRRPSLTVRELDDGRVLLHDFGGCETGAVLSALGLTLSDLFPRTGENYAPAHSRVPARDLLELISMETTTVWLIATSMRRSGRISEQDMERLTRAARRINEARDAIR